MMQNDTLTPSPQFNRSVARIKHLTDLGMRSFYFDSFGCRGRLAYLLRSECKSSGKNRSRSMRNSNVRAFPIQIEPFAPLKRAVDREPGTG